jgi:hypothetical protein
MGGEERRGEEGRREDDENVLNFSIFKPPSPLLSSPLPPSPFIPNIPERCSK